MRAPTSCSRKKRSGEMNAARLMAGIAGVAAAIAVAIAVHQNGEARAAAAELAAAGQKRDALLTRISARENKIRLAERRAAESEKDSGELLKAVKLVRAQDATPAAAAANRSPASSTPIVSIGSLPGQSPDEQKQFAQARAYQQALAKKRAEAAKHRAEFDAVVSQLDPVGKFNRRIEAAEQSAAKAEFHEGLRLLNAAITEKPADLPVPDRVAQLQATLVAQIEPVDVTLISDGVTFVSVSGQRAPVRFERTVVGIPPGDYEVIGRRTGFRDVVMLLQVRNGMPPPVVTVACITPAAN